MTNTGSFTHKLNDPIYGVEVKHYEGHTAFKTFPSLPGLKAGLKAIDRDIKWCAGREWGPQSRTVYITKPRWHLFDPENP